ncbi:MAG: hypothetical protein FJY20_11570 [Bacteroidetes bacterium]|nr:hypothetical protein [Bacteroidota bacterium]
MRFPLHFFFKRKLQVLFLLVAVCCFVETAAQKPGSARKSKRTVLADSMRQRLKRFADSVVKANPRNDSVLPTAADSTAILPPVKQTENDTAGDKKKFPVIWAVGGAAVIVLLLIIIKRRKRE